VYNNEQNRTNIAVRASAYKRLQNVQWTSGALPNVGQIENISLCETITNLLRSDFVCLRKTEKRLLFFCRTKETLVNCKFWHTTWDVAGCRFVAWHGCRYTQSVKIRVNARKLKNPLFFFNQGTKNSMDELWQFFDNACLALSLPSNLLQSSFL